MREILTIGDFQQELKEKYALGVNPLWSIHIVKEDDGTYDISVWDEVEDERREDTEEGHRNIKSYEEALLHMEEIIFNHPEVCFIRFPDTLSEKRL